MLSPFCPFSASLVICLCAPNRSGSCIAHTREENGQRKMMFEKRIGMTARMVYEERNADVGNLTPKVVRHLERLSERINEALST